MFGTNCAVPFPFMRRALSLFLIVVLAASGLGAAAVLVDAAPAAAVLSDPVRDIALDPVILDPEPLVGGGVEGVTITSVETQNWRVHAFAQVGDRIFVGGAFTTVSERPWAESPTHAQPFLAAFDLYTNDWVSTFTPTLDDAVWALAVHDGKLFVGGEFDTVNGVAREGLVALDPETGAIISSFVTYIDNVDTEFEGSVRALEVVGDVLYVAGDFNRLVQPPSSHGVYRLGRVDANTGVVDTGWLPRATGGGIFDIAVDAARDKAIIVGTFTSVNASASTLSGAVVNLTDGATVAAHPMATNGNFDATFGAAILSDSYWLGGEQHYLQVHDADDWSVLGCMSTGRWVGPECNKNIASGHPAGTGGDYQLVEELDGYVIAA